MKKLSLEYVAKAMANDLNGQSDLILETLDKFDEVTIPEDTLIECIKALDRMKNIISNIYIE